MEILILFAQKGLQGPPTRIANLLGILKGSLEALQRIIHSVRGYKAARCLATPGSTLKICFKLRKLGMVNFKKCMHCSPHQGLSTLSLAEDKIFFPL